ncbi:MAG: AI-2E family transporter [Lachnospiraceae bacterium]|nr:AI-2E family transporter [Lachnospiraceae bacterium]
MVILRIPYAVMVGTLVGVTAVIPIVGAYVSAIIGAIMILTVDPVKAVVFIIYIVILQETENNLIYQE